MIAKITRAYVRHYSDNGQVTVYVEWVDHKGVLGRTEGNCANTHMIALVNRAKRECVTIETEKW